MPKKHKPRAGSLQFWPRKRSKKLLPSVNWFALQKKHESEKERRILGFIGYKVGMMRCLAKDITPDSLTKNKQIILPLTLVECPPVKIFSTRFYKNNKVALDILSEDLDKELKRKLKLPKSKKQNILDIEKRLDDFDDIHIIIYSVVKKTGIKKRPDLTEVGITGTVKEKFEFIKGNLNKEINVETIFNQGGAIDVRGLTKGHGFTGTIKRFGFRLRQKKSEKGVRRPGSVGPWTPSRVTFRAPMAGQHGFFSRIQYNSAIINIGAGKDLAFEFKNYGKIKTNYIILKGSIQGPAKRQLLLTASLKQTKKSLKRKFELLKLLK